MWRRTVRARIRGNAKSGMERAMGHAACEIAVKVTHEYLAWNPEVLTKSYCSASEPRKQNTVMDRNLELHGGISNIWDK